MCRLYFTATALIGILIVSIFLCPSVPADSDSQIFSQSWMDEKFDFVLRIDPVKAENYLCYQGCKIQPIICCKVSIHVNPTYQTLPSAVYTPYEELWYGHGQILGCKRLLEHLPLQAGLRGAIFISQSELIESNDSAFAHAISSCILNVGLLKSKVVAVLLTEDSIKFLSAAMEEYGFLPPDSGIGEPIPESLTILLTSGEASKNTTMLTGPMPNY